jgi:signal transduction histidine kinase
MELSEQTPAQHTWVAGDVMPPLLTGVAALMASAGYSVICVDSDLRILFEARTGTFSALQPEPVLAGRALEDAWAGFPKLVRALQAAVEGEEQMRVEGWGQRQWMLHAFPLSAKQSGGAIALCLDLTGILQELQLKDHELRLFFAQMPVSVWVTDEHLRITRVAGPLLDSLRLDAGEIVGRTIGAFLGLDPKDTDNDLLSGHYAALGGQTVVLTHESKGRTFKVYLEPVKENGSAPRGVIGLGVDVSEDVAQWRLTVYTQKRLEEAQRLAHVGNWEWQIGSDRIEWSDELHAIYGLHPGEFEGTFEAFMSRVHPEDRKYTEQVVLHAVQTLKPYVYDHRILRPDGSVRMLHSQGEVVGEPGRPPRMVGCCWDVTESWETRTKLEQTVSLLQATFDSTADGILVVDRAEKIVAMNEQFFRMWRIRKDVREQRDDRRVLESVTEQLTSPETFMGRVKELYAHPDIESFDVLHFKDGRVFERYSRPQHLGADIVGRVWSFRDVTRKDRLLRRAVFLAETGRLLASLDVEHAAEAVGQLAVPLLGDVCALDLFVDSEGPRRLFVAARRSHDEVPAEIPRAAYSGTSTLFEHQRRWFMSVPLRARETLLGLLTLGSGYGTSYSREDLSFAEELAQRLALAFDNSRLYQQAHRALKTRDEFLSIAAHELRRPATALRLALQSLRQGGVPPERADRLMEMADRQVRQMDTFIDELLDVSRIRADRLHLELEEVDLAEVVRDLSARMSPELNKAGSNLTVVAEGDTRGVWDRMRLEQLVGNLLSNAVKFGEGKPIGVEVRRRGEGVELKVSDQGIGIPPEKVEAIFRPFERAVSSRHFGGLGLGLYICQSVVRALGGTIQAESHVGRGSTMLVRLPIRPVQSPSE